MKEIVQMIEKKWKEFNVSLPKLKEEIESLLNQQIGFVASFENLLICFSEPLTPEEEQQIHDLWDSIDENHIIATSYKSAEQIRQEEEQRKQQRQQAIEAIKQSALTKSWDEMSMVERKAAMNMELTDQELGLE